MVTGAGAVDTAPADAPDAAPGHDGPGQSGARPARRSLLGGIGTIVSRVAKGRSHDLDGDPGEAVTVVGSTATADPGAPFPLPAAAPLRETRPGLRAEASLNLPATSGSSALDPVTVEQAQPASEGRELRRPGSVDLVFERVDDRVRPISTLGDPVEPLVIDDYVTEPAYDPVIGPELTAARTRLGLSVDDLAERTRIRPHVIESIEVDDFAPCGGDFYARGHLRTLARILGKDVEPLLEKFEERYATAPVNARRVFEAELATGMTGSMRSTVGGPNWGLLVGVVLSLVLVWGVVRLFTTEPVEMVEMPAPVLNGSAGVDNGYPAPAPTAGNSGVVEPVTVRLTASQSDSEVVVRDGDGMVVFSGELVLGERKTLRLAPPVRIRAADGGAVEVRVAGRDRGLLGEAGEPARRTFR
jgi:cytoskeletal protein RodZ